MPATGLTQGLIKRRTRHGGSATSDTTLSHYASGPISHTTSVPGGAVVAPIGTTPAVSTLPSGVAASTPATPSGVSAAQKAAIKQENMLAKFILRQAKKAVVSQDVKFDPQSGKAQGLKVTPRQFGEDLHTAAENIRKADYRSAGLSSQAKQKVQKANAQGKVVPLKGLARLSQPSVTRGFTPGKTTKASTGVGRTLSGQQKAVTGLPRGAQRKASKALASSRPGFTPSSIVSALGGDPHSLGLSGDPLTSGVGVDPGAQLKKTDPKDLAIAAATIAAPEVGGALGRTVARLLKFAPEGKAASEEGASIASRIAGSASKAKSAVKDSIAKSAEKPLIEPRGKFKTRLAAAPAIVAPPHKGNNPAQIAEALVKGHVDALEEDPIGTLQTTARALPSAITFPAALLYETGKAATGGGTGGLQGLAKETEGFAKTVGGDLLSGDPNRVKKAVENDVGLSFLVPLPRILGGEKGVALRGATREKLAAATSKLADKGILPDKARISPESPHLIRRDVAVSSRRIQHAAEFEASHFKKEVVSAVSGGKRPVAPKWAKAKEDIGGTTVTPGDTIHIVAKYGLSREDPGRVLSLLRERVGPGVKSEGKGVVTASQAVTFLERHPEVLKAKGYWKAVDQAKESGKRIATSPRATYMGVGDLHNVTRPEDRVPVKAREFTDARTRAAAEADVKERRSTAKKLRSQAHDDSVRAQSAKGAQRTKLRQQASAARKQAQELDSGAKKLSQALAPYTRAGQSLDRTKRIKYDRQTLNEYVNDVKAKITQHGHEEPAHLPQVTIGHRGAGEVSKAFAAGAKAPHVAAMDELQHQHIDNSLRSLVAGGIERPRIQKGWHEFLKRFVSTQRRKVDGKSVVTRADFEKAVAEGKIDPKFYVLLPSRDYFQAVKDRFTNPGSLSDDLRQRLGQVQAEHAALEDAKGTKYVVVHRAAAEELRGMLDQPGVLEKALNANAKLWNRVLLGLSPGWELAQVVAEGIPILTAHPEIPLKAPKYVSAYNKLTQDEARGYASLAGEAPRVIDQPMQLRPTLPEDANKEVGAFVRATSRNPILRGMWSTARARPLGLFDRWRTGKYRSTLMTAELDRDLNGFVRGLRGSLHFSKETAAKLKGKPLHEQMAWLSKHPEEMRKLQNYVDDVMGNWDAFSRFERQFAPALIFYPFIRYSLRWTFWSFPLRHPIKTQMLYFLGQMNANELEKLLGAKPQTWTDYSNPVLYSGSGKPSAILPLGRRIAPGLSAPTEALGSGNIAGLVGALNPSLAVPIESLFGVSAFTGEQTATTLEQKGLLALNQLLAMPAPLRLLGVKAGPTSDVTKEFNRIDPNRQERSALMPYLPLSAERYRLQNTLDKLLGETGNKPEFGDFLQAVQSGDRNQVRALVKQYNLSEKASKELDQFLPPQPGEKKDLSITGSLMNHLQFENGPISAKDLKKILEGKSTSSSSSSGGGYLNDLGGYSSGYKGSSGGYLGSGGSSKKTSFAPKRNVRIPNRLAALPGRTKGQSVLAADVRKKGVPKKLAQDNRKHVIRIPTGGNLSKNQQIFAGVLAKETGMSPKLAASWMIAEEPAGQDTNPATGNQNWLNIGYPGHITRAAQNSAFDTPVSAGKATAAWMKGKFDPGNWAVASSITQNLGNLKGVSTQEFGQRLAASGWGTDANNAIANVGSFGTAKAKVSGKVTGASGGISAQKAIKKYGRGKVVKQPGVQTSQGQEPQIKQRLHALSGLLGKPVYIISGYRSPAHSVAVGGFADDPHTKGEAADIGVGSPTLSSMNAVSDKELAKVGLYRPFSSPSEINHVQLLGSGPTGTTGGSTTYSTGGGSTGATTGTPYTASTGGVSPTVLNAAQQSIGRSKELTAVQKLHLIDTLSKPNGALKLLGIPGAFTARGSLTSDGAKMLAQLSADRLRLLGTSST